MKQGKENEKPKEGKNVGNLRAREREWYKGRKTKKRKKEIVSEIYMKESMRRSKNEVKTEWRIQRWWENKCKQ